MLYKDSKVEFVKASENVNSVKLSSIYANNCSSLKYVIVDDEMLEYLITSEQKENNKERRFHRHYIALPDNETAAAKMGAMTSSVEEKFLSKADTEEMERILAIISSLTKENLSFEDIGRAEGVSASAIKHSVEIAFTKLKPYSDFYKVWPPQSGWIFYNSQTLKNSQNTMTKSLFLSSNA